MNSQGTGSYTNDKFYSVGKNRKVLELVEFLPPNSRLGKVIGVLQIRKVLTQSPYPPGNMGAVSDIDIPVRDRRCR